MTALVILLALALVASLRMQSSRGTPAWTACTAVLAAATLAAAGLKLARGMAPRQRSADGPPIERIARAVARDFPSGDVLVIRMPPALIGRDERTDTTLREIRSGLHGSAVRLVGPESEGMPEITNAWRRVFATSRPDAELFRAYLRVHTGTVAVISLVGLPACAPAELPPSSLPFYVLGNGRDFTNALWQGSGRLRHLNLLQ